MTTTLKWQAYYKLWNPTIDDWNDDIESIIFEAHSDMKIYEYCEV